MAIKTFTVGEVLTAADTNTYLANSGQVLLSQTNFGPLATNQFTSAFNATYRNYRALITITASAATAVYLRLLVGTTVQTGNILSIEQRVQLSAGTIAIGTRADQYGLGAAAFPTYASTYAIDFYAPEVSTAYTNYNIIGTGGRSATDSDSFYNTGRNIATTSINGFELLTASATTLTGTMTLYGVRNV
jgi:hypothetical protein